MYHFQGLDNAMQKMSIFPKLIYRFNAIPIKISLALLWIKFDKLILKFLWKSKGSRIVRTMSKKIKVWELMPPDINIYCKTL